MMTVKSKRIVLIPAYCPDKKLVDLVKTLKKMDFTIVIVNDGSKAEHTPIFNAVSVFATVLTHEKNRGKGAALKTGLEYIKNTTINNLRNYPKIYRYALWLYICIFQYWYMFFKRLSCGQCKKYIRCTLCCSNSRCGRSAYA